LYPIFSINVLCQCRRSSHAWRPLGYIANENIFFSGAERNENSPDIKNERFHVILDSILRSYKYAQGPGVLDGITLKLGKLRKVVNLYVPLQFIIGDVEGGDQLCGRYMYRRKDCNHLCHTCDVSTEDSTHIDIQCKRIEVGQV